MITFSILNLRTLKILVSLLAVLALVGVRGVSSAVADAPAPGPQVFVQFTPTNLSPGGEGTMLINLYNEGAAITENEKIVDKLPAGITAVADDASMAGFPVSCSGETTVTCTMSIKASPGEEVGNKARLAIPVKVADIAEGTLVNHITAEFGGASSDTSRTTPVRISDTPAGFGFAGAEAWFTNPDGTVDTQAGSHPYELTFTFALNDTGTYVTEYAAGGQVKRIVVNVPPGIVGDTQAVPRCTLEEFERESGGNPDCPDDTQVGEDVLMIGETSDQQSVYNMVPPPGVPAQFAFEYNGIATRVNAGVRTGGDNGITERTNELHQGNITYNSLTIWGIPAEASHDEDRFGSECDSHSVSDEKCSADIASTPLLTLPTSCGEPLTFTAEALGAYENESAYASTSTTPLQADGEPLNGLQGCDLLGRFNPGIAIAPETSDADTPSGLSAEVRVPEEDLQSLTEPGLLASPNLKNTTVTLPEGVAINPGQATGLEACQPSEEALGTEGPGTEAPATCPLASKVGEDEIETPLLANKLKGNVYILQQNPPNLQLLVTASGEGVNLKLVGHVHLNEATGQLTTTFDETPELPFRRFKLTFSGGARAALATPTNCGTYETIADFTPWDTPINEDALDTSLFQIGSGPGGTGCVNPNQLPFSPTLTAGATTDQAGGYTDFSMLLTRGDGQQRIDGLQFKAPEGLTGELAHVPLCTNAQAESNTCPEASKIGHTVVESGPGPYPLVIPEPGQEPAPIYLTEAYGGAPFGLSIVVPLHVGPFTLPTQRVRARIEINSTTSALTVTTNPLPQEVSGVPTDLREVDAVIERPEFMVNPTNCNPQEFTGTAYGTPPPGQGGASASAPISSHFQVGSCQALKFEPKFTVAASGKNSKAEGASLIAKVTYPSVPQGSDADIGYVKIELPKQLPSRLTTLQKACLAATFEANPAACPSESKIGYATVHTPLLPVPLSGPVIFVSHGGEAFPSLTVVLQGDGVTIDLTGATFISKAGITSTTFKTVPDDPFSTFELTLPQGKFSALAANVPSSAHYSLCGQKLTMPNEFIGQNGAVIKQTTPITITGCAKVKTLTRAQKLTKALSACRKQDKGKAKRHKREGCEKTARKRYGSLKKKKKAKSKSTAKRG